MKTRKETEVLCEGVFIPSEEVIVLMVSFHQHLLLSSCLTIFINNILSVAAGRMSNYLGVSKTKVG